LATAPRPVPIAHLRWLCLLLRSRVHRCRLRSNFTIPTHFPPESFLEWRIHVLRLPKCLREFPSRRGTNNNIVWSINYGLEGEVIAEQEAAHF
jgi:hypothetical protein